MVPIALLGCTSVHAQGPYIELRGGLANLSSLSGTGTLNWPETSSPSAGVRGDIEYGGAAIFGIEAGMRRMFDTPFALSVTLDTFRAELDSASFDSDVTEEQEYSSQALADRNLDFDQRTFLLGANGFYEFDMEKVKLYTGAGFAGAFIGNSDVEFGPMVHAGMRYEIKPLGYLSARASWFRSGGPQHKATGLEFDDFQFTAFTMAFGMDLWQ